MNLSQLMVLYAMLPMSVVVVYTPHCEADDLITSCSLSPWVTQVNILLVV